MSDPTKLAGAAVTIEKDEFADFMANLEKGDEALYRHAAQEDAVLIQRAVALNEICHEFSSASDE